jgi:hypothetical protein
MGDFGIVPPVPYTRIFPDKPLGDLQKNDFKFLAAPELLEQAKDKAQLVKVTNAVNQQGQKNNASKKRSQTNGYITASGVGKNDLDDSPIADR